MHLNKKLAALAGAVALAPIETSVTGSRSPDRRAPVTVSRR
jgi:hypothetical protein